jgi:hypothetical protein
MPKGATEATVVAARLDFKREPGWLYFVDKAGDLSRCTRAVGHYSEPPKKTEKVVKLGIKKQKGLWYYAKGNSVLARPVNRGNKSA